MIVMTFRKWRLLSGNEVWSLERRLVLLPRSNADIHFGKECVCSGRWTFDDNDELYPSLHRREIVLHIYHILDSYNVLEYIYLRVLSPACLRDFIHSALL